MLSFVEFKELVGKYLANEIEGAIVTPVDVKKVQGKSYYGLCICTEGNMGVTVNVGSIYEAVSNGIIDFDTAMKNIVTDLKKALDDMPSINIEMFTNYEIAKDYLTVNLIPRTGNEEILSIVPYKEWNDLAIVYRIVEGNMSVLVRTEMLREFNVTAEELHRDAMKSSAAHHPAVINTMKSVLMRMKDESDESVDVPDELFDSAPNMLVCTNAESLRGAGVILYPEVLHKAAEMVGGDFYIIPSSIHEVLFLPAENASVGELVAMVRSVNDEQLPPEDRLSYSVYHCNAETCEVTIAEMVDCAVFA